MNQTLRERQSKREGVTRVDVQVGSPHTGLLYFFAMILPCRSGYPNFLPVSVYSSFPAILLRAIPYQDVLRTPNVTEQSTMLQKALAGWTTLDELVLSFGTSLYMTLWSDAWLAVLPTSRTNSFVEYSPKLRSALPRYPTPCKAYKACPIIDLYSSLYFRWSRYVTMNPLT